MTWLLANALPFVLKYWKALLLALLVLSVWGGIKWHLHKDRETEARAAKYYWAWGKERDEKAALLAKLADAEKAAKAAIAEKAQAEQAAEKRLKAREKEWRRIYGAKPENKAWAERKVPADVLENLR